MCQWSQPFQLLAAPSGCLNLPASLDLKDHASICLVFSARIWMADGFRNFGRTFDDLQHLSTSESFHQTRELNCQKAGTNDFEFPKFCSSSSSLSSSNFFCLLETESPPATLKPSPECNRSDPVSPLKQHRIAKRSNHLWLQISTKKPSPEVSVCFSDSTKPPIFHGRCWLSMAITWNRKNNKLRSPNFAPGQTHFICQPFQTLRWNPSFLWWPWKWNMEKKRWHQVIHHSKAAWPFYIFLCCKLWTTWNSFLPFNGCRIKQSHWIRKKSVSLAFRDRKDQRNSRPQLVVHVQWRYIWNILIKMEDSIIPCNTQQVRVHRSFVLGFR